ncbi:MAG: hypothetical protein HY343_12695, partial [Lentisphaerae bacterium]|nr:hypothetical protein [Lentisphaerota bacterium]
GEAGATEAETGAVLRVSADGRWCVGTVWEGACEIFQNGDGNSCIHSVPSVGDLQPGETQTVTGRLVFVEGGPEAALKRLYL